MKSSIQKIFSYEEIINGKKKIIILSKDVSKKISFTNDQILFEYLIFYKKYKNSIDVIEYDKFCLDIFVDLIKSYKNVTLVGLNLNNFEKEFLLQLGKIKETKIIIYEDLE